MTVNKLTPKEEEEVEALRLEWAVCMQRIQPSSLKLIMLIRLLHTNAESH